jgi:hypothetical protein
VESPDVLRRRAPLAPVLARAEAGGHLPGAARWIAPELCPICSPWLLSPANVMLVLGKAIVHFGDLVCVGGRALCKQAAALAREA